MCIGVQVDGSQKNISLLSNKGIETIDQFDMSYLQSQEKHLIRIL